MKWLYVFILANMRYIYSYRDPHLSRIRTTSGETRIARNKNLQWDQYDPKYKKYLLIGKSYSIHAIKDKILRPKN